MRFFISTCLLVVGLAMSSLAIDSLEYIALKRIEKHKKPRIIQVPIYTVKHEAPAPRIPSYESMPSVKFPLYVPIENEQPVAIYQPQARAPRYTSVLRQQPRENFQAQQTRLEPQQQFESQRQFEPEQSFDSNEGRTIVRQVPSSPGQMTSHQISINHDQIASPQTIQVIHVPAGTTNLQQYLTQLNTPSLSSSAQ